MKLKKEYYRKDDVFFIAKDLIGKVLVSEIDNIYTSGIITETEAYHGVYDRACHAFGGRRTSRTEIMYSPGGVAYIYLCYGLHSLFNIVTNVKDIPEAILIRALYPLDGIEHMLKRRNRSVNDKILTGGPGTVSQAMGFTLRYNGTPLNGRIIYIEDRGIKINKADIKVTKRIGVEGAKEAADYLYRYVVPFSRISGLVNESKERYIK